MSYCTFIDLSKWGNTLPTEEKYFIEELTDWGEKSSRIGCTV